MSSSGLWCHVVWQKFTNVSEVLAASIIMVTLIALMMEAARTSETLGIFYLTTRRYNPEDSHLRTFKSVGHNFNVLPRSFY
jgi:hypothetical protein